MATPASSLLPQLGSDAEFRALREAFTAVNFTEQGVRERLGLARISDFKMGEQPGSPPEDRLGALVWLLMRGATVPAAAVPAAELLALGLLVDQDGGVRSPVMVYPVRGLWLASDRPTPLSGEPSRPTDDVVYPAITPNTEQFLDLVPFGECDALLDLCGGSGVGAMVAATNGAKHAWSGDITARSTHFAEFNRRLNGLANVAAVESDIYSGVPGLTFDRIIVHPPYVPVFRHSFVYDSGGQDGEQIVRPIVQGLPQYLRPGGLCYILLAGTDRKLPFEQRVRQWLGAAESDFDVVFITRRRLNVPEYTADMMMRNLATADEIREWREELKRLGVEMFTYGFLAIQRREKSRPVFTVRRKAGPGTGREQYSWLIGWETSIAANGAEAVLGMRLRAAPHATLKTEHKLTADGWAPTGFLFEVERPFDMELRTDAWAAYLLAAADGTLTGGELLDKLKSDELVSPDTPRLEFAQMLARLVSGGLLEVA